MPAARRRRRRRRQQQPPRRAMGKCGRRWDHPARDRRRQRLAGEWRPGGGAFESGPTSNYREGAARSFPSLRVAVRHRGAALAACVRLRERAGSAGRRPARLPWGGGGAGGLQLAPSAHGDGRDVRVSLKGAGWVHVRQLIDAVLPPPPPPPPPSPPPHLLEEM